MSRPLDEYDVPQFSKRALDRAVAEAVAAERERLRTCPTPCDADCEQLCHEVHDIPSHQDHDPEHCRATQLGAARAAERECIIQLALQEADENSMWAPALTWLADLLRKDTP